MNERSQQIRAYLGCSLDGFIAGPDGDLSWLDGAQEARAEVEAGGALSYEGFIEGVGALLMGRATYEVVAAFEGPWPYGALPILVATRRPIEAAPPSVRALSGSIHELLDAARAAAGSKDVYLDGGDLIRQAIEANLLDELVLTQVPVILGGGISLFAGLGRRVVEISKATRYGASGAQLAVRFPIAPA